MKFARVINVLAICLLIAAAVHVYRIKYQATWQAEEVARLERQIAREHSSIAVLDAEWAYLLRPDRIQVLAEKNLDLKAADSRQRVTLSDVPMRPARVDSIAETIASLAVEEPALEKPPEEDAIARTIEALGLSRPSGDSRVERTMNSLGIGGQVPSSGIGGQ